MDPPTDPVMCPELKKPHFGFVNTISRLVGGMAFYTCQDTFCLVGPEKLTCLANGYWDKAGPICQKECPDLENIPNGTVHYENKKLGSMATYECTNLPNRNFTLVGIKKRTCTFVELEVSEWRPDDEPYCDPCCRHDLTIINGEVVVANPCQEGGTAYVICNPGYGLQQNISLTCLPGAKWSGTFPDRCIVKCPPLGSVLYGTLDVSGYYPDDHAIVTCDPGFQLNVDYNTSHCTNQGRWSPSIPECIPQCPLLKPPKNGSVTATNGIAAGSIATYSCDEGFYLVGNKTSNCTDLGGRAVWNKEPPRCQERCPTLDHPANGRVTYNETSRKVGEYATYECIGRFDLVGSMVRECQSNAEWNGTEPYCRPHCSPLTAHPKQTFDPEKDDLSYSVGDTVTLSCESDDYGINPSVCDPDFTVTLTCQSDSTWSADQPICHRMCSLDDIRPLADGNFTVTGCFEGDMVFYACKPGYKRDGNEKRTCTPNGVWNRQAPLCRRMCPDPEPLLNGRYTQTGTLVGDTTTYVCNGGFDLIDGGQEFPSKTVTCMENGIWSDGPPYCRPQCGPPEAPGNGRVDFDPNKVSVGDTATYHCDDLFEPIGDTIATCILNANGDAVWDPPPLYCQPHCPHLEDLPNQMIYPRRPQLSYAVGETATFSCGSGYGINETDPLVCLDNSTWTLTCLPNSTWSGDQPKCYRICPVEDIRPLINGNFTVKGCFEGYMVCYECGEDYKLIGNEKRTCTPNGFWDRQAPICIRMCPEVPPLPNGYYTQNGTLVGDITTYFCNETFDLIDGGRELPSKTVRCMEDGMWSDGSPTCRPQCGPPEAPHNGRVDFDPNEVSVGDTATYHCNALFELIGETMTTCKFNASGHAVWDPPPPDCQPHCPRLEDLPNQTIYPRRPKLSYAVGETVTFSCGPGYGINETDPLVCLDNSTWTMTCLDNSTWDDTQPKCYRICPMALIRPLINGNFTFTGCFEGYQVCYQCDEGYELDGNEKRTCTPNGVWNRQAPLCKRKCVDVKAPFNGNYTQTGKLVGDTTTYYCDDGYDLVDRDGQVLTEKTVTCMDDGLWSGGAPYCRPKCSVPVPPENGGVSSTTTRSVGDTVEFHCNDEGVSFELIGSRRRTCHEVDFHRSRWDGTQPFCRPLCPEFEAYANGIIEVTTYSIGGRATCVCNQGYGFPGDAVLNCLDDGEWDEQPPDCLRICPSLNDPPNGMVMDFSPNYEGDCANYSCNTDYELIPLGHEETCCQPDGNWSLPEPTCRPLCPVLNNPQFGSVDMSGRSVGDTADYLCNTNYTLDGFKRLWCLNGGMWSNTEPRCLPDCEKLPEPSNGEITYDDLIVDNEGMVINNGLSVGDEATYFCLPELDFELIPTGEETTTCKYNESSGDSDWTGPPRSCRMLCPEIEVENGEVSYIPNRSWGSMAELDCDDGYGQIVEVTLTCDNGEWDGDFDPCHPKCPEPRSLTNGSYIVNQVSSTGYFPGDEVRYACDPGYEMIGNDRQECTSRGYWSGVPPICRPLCSEPRPLTNGMVNYPNTSVGAVANYVCNEGYDLIGANSVRCMQKWYTAIWNGNPPFCQKQCSKAEAPGNGNVAVNGTGVSVFNQAIFTCNFNYELIGTNSLTCLEGGEWSGGFPFCRPLCPNFGTLGNGSFTVTAGNSVGSVANFSCDGGHVLVGEPSPTCLFNGEWSSPLPYCSDVCPDPEEGIDEIDSLMVNSTGVLEGDTVEYWCPRDWKISGSANAVCRYGQWEFSNDDHTPPCCIGCITRLYVMTFQSNIIGRGSYQAPQFFIELRNGMKSNVSLAHLEDENNMEENFGGLWSVPMDECRFPVDCVQFNDVKSYYLQAGRRPNGWVVDSVIVLANIGGTNYALASLDMHANFKLSPGNNFDLTNK